MVEQTFLGVHLDVPIVTPSKAYLMTRNALGVRREYLPRQFWFVDLPLTVLRGVIAARHLPGPTLPLLRHAVLRAMTDAARGRLGPPPQAVAALDPADSGGGRS